MARRKRKQVERIETEIPVAISVPEAQESPAEIFNPRAGRVSGRAPDRNIALLTAIRQVMEMRNQDGPQRFHFKTQVAAYALTKGPRLPRAQIAELLNLSGPAVNYSVESIEGRLNHEAFSQYVERITNEMKLTIESISSEASIDTK